MSHSNRPAGSPGLSLGGVGSTQGDWRSNRAGPGARALAFGREGRYARVLLDVSRWSLLGTLVLAPWAYGGTRAGAVYLLDVCMAWTCLLGAAGHVLRRQKPDIPPLALGMVVWLLVQGWWMIGNARAEYDLPLGVLLPGKPWWEGLPGSVDRSLSVFSMLTLSGLLGVFLLALDMVRRPAWRGRLWWTLAGTGCSIALFGVLVKLGGTPVMTMIWDADRLDANNNFALYRYRGNAGAFLNLVLPLAAGLMIRSFFRSTAHWSRALWVGATFLVIMGIQLNPSRAGWGIAVLVTLSLAVCWGWRAWRAQPVEAGSRRWFLLNSALGLAALTGVIWALTMMGGWETGWKRLGRVGIDLAQRSPKEIYRVMVPEAGMFGFGPGTFEAIFASYQMDAEPTADMASGQWRQAYWKYAHQDYYQALIEWGWVGALAWLGLLVGGLGKGMMYLMRHPDWASSRSGWLVAGGLAALGGALIHSLVDFPLQVVSIQLYAVMILAILWGAGGRGPQSAVRGRRTEDGFEDELGRGLVEGGRPSSLILMGDDPRA